jgi:hypothetical protein
VLPAATGRLFSEQVGMGATKMMISATKRGIYCGWFRHPAPVDGYFHDFQGFNHPFGARKIRYQ